MAKNFLFVSPSFVSQIKKGKNGEKRLKTWELVFENCDDDYKMKIKISDITIQLNEKLGCKYSDESYRRYFVIINNAREFLLEKDLDKKSVFLSEYSEILQSGDRYRSLIYSGVFCLIQDGITTWEEVEGLMNAEKTADALRKNKIIEIVDGIKPDGIKQYVMDEVKKEEVGEIIIKTNDFDTLVSTLSSKSADFSAHISCVVKKLREAYYSEIKKIEDKNVELKHEHSECVDELNRRKSVDNINRDLILGMKKLELEAIDLRKEKERDNKIIEGLRKAKQNLDLEISRLKQKNAELKKIDIGAAHKMLSELLKNIPNAMPSFEEEIQKNKKRTVNSDGLPEIYEKNNTTVNYTENFIQQFNLMDKAIANRLLKKIKAICALGIESLASRDIHLIKEGKGKTPKNVTQVTIKKLRIILGMSEDVLTFYEVFFRKNSPYA